MPNWMAGVKRDFQLMVRQVQRTPSFAITVIATVALGIGPATAMFTAVDHLLLEPLTYRDPSHLVEIEEEDGKGRGRSWGATWMDIEQWERQCRSIGEFAFSKKMGDRNYLETQDGGIQVNAIEVSSNLFSTLGVSPMLGSGFAPKADSVAPMSSGSSILLSNSIWRSVFGGDPSVVGRVVKINDLPHVIVGVMPPGFRYPASGTRGDQVWVSLKRTENDKRNGWDSDRYTVIARLKIGDILPTAAAEMAVIQERVAAAYSDPDMRTDFAHATVRLYRDTLVVGSVRTAVMALMVATGLLWLIANANAANVVLARHSVRQREIALRMALGAGWWRVAQQLVLEGFVLSSAGGLLGLAIALASVKVLSRELAIYLPLPIPLVPDFRIMLSLFGLSLISGLAVSAGPMLLMTEGPIEQTLKYGGMHAGVPRSDHRVRNFLVATQIAISLVLLVGCGSLLRTIYELHKVRLGYSTDHIIVAHLSVPVHQNRNMSADLYEPLLAQVQHLKGVESAGLMTEVPLGRTFALRVLLRVQGKQINAWIKAATPDMKRVLRFQMAAGRYFDEQDTPTSMFAIVVNEAFAHEFLQTDPSSTSILGMKLMDLTGNGPGRVVGVLADEREIDIKRPAEPEIQVCLSQLTPTFVLYRQLETVAMDLAVRTEQSGATMVPELRTVLRNEDLDLKNAPITTMDDLVEDSYGSEKLAARLLELFAAVALLVCMSGLYGLLAYVVSHRGKEMAIRLALGGQRSDLLWLIMRQAGSTLVKGAIGGFAIAFAAEHLIQKFLYGISIDDWWALAGAVVLLGASGMLAAYVPAKRAASADPVETLRSE